LARANGSGVVPALVELVCRLRSLTTLDISGIVELADDMTDLLGFLRASPTLGVLHIDGCVRSKSKVTFCEVFFYSCFNFFPLSVFVGCK
jgi:hypothetical protein